MTTFVALTAIFLSTLNNVTNWWQLPGWTYVPVNVSIAAALVGAARWQGLSWDELGLSRQGLWPGLRTGGVIAAAVAGGLALAFIVPAAERFLADNRVAGLGTSGLMYTAIVRIPLGTVVLEEIAFRGVLFGAWNRVASTTIAAIGSCAIFGIWHIVPMLEMLRTNSFGGGPGAKVGVVLLGVIGTAIGGGVLLAIRVWTGGIVGPALVHAATNCLATLAAYMWQNH
jgi:uncharacterized protein